MRLSIITVCFNCEKTIEATIQSVLSQDYDPVEYILVDGASTDGTMAMIDRYRDRISQVISEPDAGIYDAMNKGLALVTGDVVGFLNADDYLADHTVISKIAHAMQSSSVQAVYGDLDYVDPQDTLRVVRRWKAGAYRRGLFRKGWVPPHPTFYCRKEIYDRLGGYHALFGIAADFELMLRFIEKHQISVSYLPEVLVKMRTGGAANRLKGIWKGNREILDSFKLNGLRMSPLFFLYKPVVKIGQLLKKESG